jgi:enamine deaminase RidA (YjgF/YER057c/UK114 family)
MMDRIVVAALGLVAGLAAGAFAQGGLLRFINPPGLSTPTGYTHVVIPQGGRTVFIAGQVANDKSGAVVGKGDFKAQTKQVFENLKIAVEAAGGTMADVAKITIYVTDLSQISSFREVREQYLTGNLPASTLVQVVSLARPEYLLEIEAFAVVK